jgi:hypothetical protein
MGEELMKDDVIFSGKHLSLPEIIKALGSR